MAKQHKKCVLKWKQMIKLVELMEENEELATAESFDANSLAGDKWEALYCELNILGPPYKSCEEWAQTWILLKEITKKKIERYHATGGEVDISIVLSPIEMGVEAVLQKHSTNTNESSVGDKILECVKRILRDCPRPSSFSLVKPPEHCCSKRMRMLEEQNSQLTGRLAGIEDCLRRMCEQQEELINIRRGES